MLLLLIMQANENKLYRLLDNTYNGLEKLFNEDNSNFLKLSAKLPQEDKEYQTFEVLLKGAYDEVVQDKSDVLSVVFQLEEKVLKTVGLVGKQLELKLKLYYEKLRKVIEYGSKFYDFTSKQLQTFFIEEMDNLLDILNSLLALIPGMESLIEFLQSIRSMIKEIQKNY